MHGSHFWENNLLRKRTDDQSALPVSLGKLVTDQSKSFCRLPSFFPTILSPNFSFFVAFRCIKTSSCKTNCEDIVKMDSGKFGKLSVGLIVNLCFDPECKSFLEYVLASQISQPYWWLDASWQYLWNGLQMQSLKSHPRGHHVIMNSQELGKLLDWLITNMQMSCPSANKTFLVIDLLPTSATALSLSAWIRPNLISGNNPSTSPSKLFTLKTKCTW